MTRPILLSVLAGAVSASAGGSYVFDVTTSYQGGGSAFGVSANPDSGFLTVVNSGPTTFVGSIYLQGTSGNGPYGHWAGNLSATQNTGVGYTLAPGASVTFIASSEGSNYGGWNKQGGGLPDLGIQLVLDGTILGQPVNLSVYDSNIHSGVPQTTPAGYLSDAYVLQGGDPFGNDPGDGFEEAQANGHYSFRGTVVPEPGEYALMAGLGLVGFGAYRKIKRA